MKIDDLGLLRYELAKRTAKRYRFRGAWMTVAEVVDLTGYSKRAITDRISGDTIEDRPLMQRGRSAKRYTFRGQRRTVYEVADMLGVHSTTVRRRILGDAILEAHEVKAIPTERRVSERLIRFRGQTHNVTEWAAITGIERHRIFSRLNAGWSIHAALTTPAAHKRPVVLRRMIAAFTRARNAALLDRMITAARSQLHSPPFAQTGGPSQTFHTP